MKASDLRDATSGFYCTLETPFGLRDIPEETDGIK
jgi:hypothetical protein